MSKQVSIGGWAVAAVVLVGVVGGGVYLARKAMHPQPAPTSVPAPAASTAKAVPATPIQHPISQAEAGPATASTAALPALDDSDASVASALAGLAGGNELSSLLIPRQIIPRIVATVDALPRSAWGSRLLPAKPPQGAFVTQNTDGVTSIGAGNAARYAPYMQIVDGVDPAALVAWYVRTYPLFQQAYRELGYPKGYFNDRLMVAIDDMLAAPEPTAPQALTLDADKGVYRYVDPAMESLSTGQRLLLRTGPANEARIKARLRAIRARLLGHGPQPAPAAAATSARQPRGR
ncbi:MAG: DUF3014 domain-containing protein [Pseudomonadota bacterium]|nr:DUF3014 domain-containing protein [Xanthomonadaceae bacterium]MDE2248830.1 DUF3014 domain-containing protein [Xanthomonadaceae bacterium]MDE3210381.1 DUF3014 domain-containing protein [Pseudomonadota bacterium]